MNSILYWETLNPIKVYFNSGSDIYISNRHKEDAERAEGKGLFITTADKLIEQNGEKADIWSKRTKLLEDGLDMVWLSCHIVVFASCSLNLIFHA